MGTVEFDRTHQAQPQGVKDVLKLPINGRFDMRAYHEVRTDGN